MHTLHKQHILDVVMKQCDHLISKLLNLKIHLVVTKDTYAPFISCNWSKKILYQKIVLKSDKLHTALETKTLQETVVSAKPF